MHVLERPKNGKIALELDATDCSDLGVACCEAVHRIRQSRENGKPGIADEATIGRLEMLTQLFMLCLYATDPTIEAD